MLQQINRFSRILKTRQQEMNVVRSELATHQTKESSLVSAIDRMSGEKDSAMDDFCTPRGDLMDPRTMWYERQNLDLLEKGICNKKQELNTCRNDIEETKERLLERHKNVRIMEQYVSKLEVNKTKKDLLNEQNVLDDISQQRHSRMNALGI